MNFHTKKYEMKTIFSRQYDRSCIVPEPSDTADDIIEACINANATYEEGPDPQDLLYVVKVRPEVGPELWSADSLDATFNKVDD